MANVRTESVDPEVARYGHGKIKRASSIKTVYVQDNEFWEKAKEHAASIGLSLSEMVMQSLAEFMDKKTCGQCNRIREILSTGSVVIPESVSAKKGKK